MTRNLCPSCHVTMPVDATNCPTCKAPVPSPQMIADMEERREKSLRKAIEQLKVFAVLNALLGGGIGVVLVILAATNQRGDSPALGIILIAEGLFGYALLRVIAGIAEELILIRKKLGGD